MLFLVVDRYKHIIVFKENKRNLQMDLNWHLNFFSGNVSHSVAYSLSKMIPPLGIMSVAPIVQSTEKTIPYKKWSKCDRFFYILLPPLYYVVPLATIGTEAHLNPRWPDWSNGLHGSNSSKTVSTDSKLYQPAASTGSELSQPAANCLNRQQTVPTGTSSWLTMK